MRSLLLVAALIFCFFKQSICQDGNFTCWVGYANDNRDLRGGSVSCDGGTCVYINGTYANTAINLFACEPAGLCPNNVALNNINGTGLNAYCCNDASDCNTNGFTPPPPVTPLPPSPSPILCYEGLYINNKNLSINSPKICYGNCASVSATLGSTNFTVTTCDPLTLCNNLDLVNSCHTMPQQILSGCCCNSNLCIDPANNVKPTPPSPPEGSIKCFIGLQYNNDKPVGSETYCPGMCHSTTAAINNNNYTVYACDRYQLCGEFGIPLNGCTDSGGEAGSGLQSCCCNTDSCSTPPGFTPPTIDPNPPLVAERCFTGFSLGNFGPLGRSAECFGDCVTYSAGSLKIYGCDPISVCEQMNATDTVGQFHDLSVACCSTKECNYQPARTSLQCYNGIKISSPEHGVAYAKVQSLPCVGQCATFGVQYKHLGVQVFTCDPYNVCNLGTSDILQVNCCNNTDNCNLNTTVVSPTILPTPVSKNQTIQCFQGFRIGEGFPFGNRMSCDGACARAHIGKDTIYTCDPGDTCSDFGLDGCHMLFDGLTICCCKGQRCNDPEIRIPPAVKQDLNCFVGYGVAGSVIGGQIPCAGMCGKLSTNISNVAIDAYVCLDPQLCYDRRFYERCGNVVTDVPIRSCCCGGYDHCNYEPQNGTVAPPEPSQYNETIVCPQGLYINGFPLYEAKKTVVTCPNDCGLIQFNTSFHGSTASFAYYGCDPATLCDKFDLKNRCGALGSYISGCCCSDYDLCMNPAIGRMIPVKPTPPPNTLKCFIGVRYNNEDPVGAESYCPGLCHNTTTTINKGTYTVYSCDRYQLCGEFGIQTNGCSDNEVGSGLQSCCCDSDSCSSPPGFTSPTVDPNPPIQAERCFAGFALKDFGPLGRSAECFGDCVTYSAGDLKIYGCDPISVCEQFGAKNTTNQFHDLNVTCCSTRECNYQHTRTSLQCYNGLTISSPEHGVAYAKVQSLPCLGRCATFGVQYKHLGVQVYTCDPYNVCNLGTSDMLQVNCCDTDNCNINTTVVSPTKLPLPTGNQTFQCFQGFQIRRGFPFGNRMSCDGACARVHIGTDTIYTCDPGDTCSDFGLDGCHMLFDGLTICCCKGERCNEPERRIRPAIKQDLNCFVGFGSGNMTSGGQLPCDGMCGKLSTMISNTQVDAYVCLQQEMCEDRDLYEHCGSIRTDQAVRACCCGGYDHCNYEPINGTVPTPPSSSNNITCPEGLYLNGKPIYHRGSTYTQCPNDCGVIHFNTTAMNSTQDFAYYGCDPASMCSDFKLSNSCNSMGNFTSGCCCSSDLCMNPIVGKMTPDSSGSNVKPTGDQGGSAISNTLSVMLLAVFSLCYVV